LPRSVSRALCWHVPSPEKRPAQRLEVHVLDVGYGEAVVLVAPGRRFILWDAGYQKEGAKVAEYLHTIGVEHLDLVINSHPHPDHIGGLAEIITQFPVKEIWGSHPLLFSAIPEEFRLAIQLKKASYKTVRRGDMWSWTEKITIEILNPHHLTTDLNDSSLVAQIRFGLTSLLLTADIGPKAQMELISCYGAKLHSDFMTIPHHGGLSHLPFFQLVNPKVISLSIGPNPWGNPHQETLNYLTGMGLQIQRTDQHGRLVIDCDGYAVIQMVGSGVHH